jgi:ribosomal protein S18 acetylase RimI-like enzyme
MATSSGPCVRPYEPPDRRSVVALWSACGLLRPWNDPDRDIERKVSHDGEGLLVLEVDGRIVGSVMVGYEGHRGWVNYLAVDPAHRGEDFGTLLMGEAERRLAQRGCPKVNLQVRAANGKVLDFYRRLGYVPDEVVSMGKRLVDEAGERPVPHRPATLEGPGDRPPVEAAHAP